tara:strand:+ start:2489 stop:2842 length:354 start_codon:yes stop_codon:yes gene_type:complete
MASDSETGKVGPPDNLQDQLVEQIIANLRRVYDPEINLNVYDLGLIYQVAVNKEYDANVIMTLTSPNCPAAEVIPMEVEFATRAVECINKVKVTLTFDPPWNPDAISDEGKYQIGIL